VLDRYEGDALVTLTKYKKGAQAVMERLEAYERRIADLSQSAAIHPSDANGPQALLQLSSP
jgi:hypothetical protein